MFASERKAKAPFTKDRGLIASRIMEKEPLTKLTWRGHETVEAIPSLLDRAGQIEIDLPAGYNHSLFRLLHPHAPPAQLEDIEVSGGPQLLVDIASTKGLEELARLAEPLTVAHATVTISSPPKVVITLPGANLKKPTH
jgi:hypothetical protein